MNTSLETARTKVQSKLTLSVSSEFVGEVCTAIRNAGPGGLVMAGCSPAIEQAQVLQCVVERLGGSSAICFALPPYVTGFRAQMNCLRDRYLQAMRSPNIGYKYHPLFIAERMISAISPMQAMVNSISEYDIGLVGITEGQNICARGKSEADVDATLRQLCDIAAGSNTTHVVFGTIAEVWGSAKTSSLVSQIQFVMQSVCPVSEEGQIQFISQLKAYDEALSGCCDFRLVDQFPTFLTRVHGDHRRVGTWLLKALNAAEKDGRLTLAHMEKTAPNGMQVKDAGRTLKAWENFTECSSFVWMPVADETEESKPVKRNLKPGERSPSHDIAPKAA
jgi:hypothetical protein